MAKRYQFPRTVRLLGGFNCELTPDEENQFRNYMVAHPAYIAHLELVRAQEVCGACVVGGAIEREQELAELLKRIDDATPTFYAIGKEWFEALVATTDRVEEVEA